MRTLPASVILEKNKLANDAPFLILLDIVLVSTTTIRLVRNTSDIVYGGNTYTAFPFELNNARESNTGEIEAMQIMVGNVTRSLQAYLEEENGCIGAEVTITVLHADHLTDVALELTYSVVGSYSDAYWVYLSLGMVSPLRKRFPLYRYLSHCNWVGNYKGDECKYSGAEPPGETSCDGSYDACSRRANTAKFGGHIGLRNASVKLA